MKRQGWRPLLIARGGVEDYAAPGYNALVLETAEPREFIGLFGELRGNPAQEQAIRQAGRLTAQHYVWPQILQRNLLPRIRLDELSAHSEAAELPRREGRTRMRVQQPLTNGPFPQLRECFRISRAPHLIYPRRWCRFLANHKLQTI